MDITRYEITAGPSIHDIQSSLFRKDGYENNKSVILSQSVTFTLASGKLLYVLLSSVEREDGSGNSWIFQGRIVQEDKIPNRQWVNCNGWFSTSARKGFIQRCSYRELEAYRNG